MGIFGKKVKDAEIEKSDAVAAPAESTTTSAQTVKSTYSGEARACGVIVAPLVSEKTHILGKEGKYVFRVERKANKKVVKKLISEIYKVGVKDINIVNVPKKRRTIKYDRGYQSAYKKAIVTLKKGERITALDLA